MVLIIGGFILPPSWEEEVYDTILIYDTVKGTYRLAPLRLPHRMRGLWATIVFDHWLIIGGKSYTHATPLH